jgi:hypothetical protein
MNRLLVSSCFSVMLTLSAAGAGWSQATANPTDPAPAEIAHPVPVKLPIRLFWNYLVMVEGSIGNVRKLHFLVDTGAYPSIVDQKIARNLGLAEQPARVNLANKSIQTGRVILPSLLLGPLRVEALPVLTQDLSYMEKAVGYKVDAIIGLFESRISDSAGLQTIGTQETVNASGTLRLRKVWIPDVYLGQERIGGQAAFIVNDHKDAGDDFDGVLGMKAPQQSKIAFDFERRRFSWDLSEVGPGVAPGVAPAATLAINNKTR